MMSHCKTVVFYAYTMITLFSYHAIAIYMQLQGTSKNIMMIFFLYFWLP